MIGNDVVDLRLPEVRGKAADERFVGRVCTPTERSLLREASHPDLTLWAMWAAKEASFKALRRTDDSLWFSPRACEVQGASPTGHTGSATGRTETDGGSPCMVAWSWTDQYLHCLAWPTDAPPEDRTHRVREIPGGATPEERSRAVRALACDLLDARRLPGCRIVRPTRENGREPPMVMRGTHCVERATVSLSHDGRWVAAALSLDPCHEPCHEAVRE